MLFVYIKLVYESRAVQVHFYDLCLYDFFFIIISSLLVIISMRKVMSLWCGIGWKTNSTLHEKNNLLYDESR